MSTPQEPHDRNAGQTWDPPADSTVGPGTTNDGQNPYSYPAAPSSGYAYPTPGGDAGAAGKGPAPKEVERAYHLILAAGVLSLISAVIAALTGGVPEMAGASPGAAITTILFAVISTAIYVVLAVFIRKGKNWARITATVLMALSVLGTLSTFLLQPMMVEIAASAGQAVPETPGLLIASDVIVTLLGVAGVVMTYLKPARPYFKARQLGY